MFEGPSSIVHLLVATERGLPCHPTSMDQSASVLSQLGAALHVTFHPSLSARPVFFPTPGQGIPELCFVVAQSFVAADKHVTGPIHYNLRVVECTLAAAYLNAVLVLPKVPATASNGGSLPHDASPLGVSLRGFHENYFAHAYDAAGEAEEAELSQSQQLEHLAGVVERTLVKEDGYTREEIAETLGTSVAELEKRFMSAFPVRADRFMLRQRALHVFTEARRVLRFLELLEDPDHEPGAEGENLAVRLGALLNASQASCRDLYDCSCPEIDELCALARDAGSYGSRLTGAGWGGCTVHLVSAEKVDAVREALEKGYYKRLREQGKVTEEQMKEAVVVSKPGGGSVVIVLDDKGNLKG